MPRVVHFEIHAENPKRAIKFYEAVFEWTFHQWPGPWEYWLVTTGSKDEPGIDGGLVLRRGPAPAEAQPVNAYVCTVQVPNADAAVEAAVGAGGSIAVSKMAVPGVGWLAYVKDTEGNLLGVMQADSAAAEPS
jgi:predicted enzyme related to lactoylglutathione lyase